MIMRQNQNSKSIQLLVYPSRQAILLRWWWYYLKIGALFLATVAALQMPGRRLQLCLTASIEIPLGYFHLWL